MPRNEVGLPLLKRVTCPTCWHEFLTEDVLWVAVHDDLIDDRLAEGGPLRFSPTRFTVEGFAYDEHGGVCTDLACPRCLNIIVPQLLRMPPLFMSILGAPGSGKSFYLAAAIRQLKRTLFSQLSLGFQNVNPLGNRLLTEYEHTLFEFTGGVKWVKLAKTDIVGDQWYYSVRIDDRDMRLPRPYQYAIQPTPQHPHFSELAQNSRVLCLYDNAGESFLPDAVSGSAPVIDHLGKSEALLFVFDPLQEAEFRQHCIGRSRDPQVEYSPFRYPQADVLATAADRIRKLTRMPTGLYPKPLIVIVNKFDAWECLVRGSLDVLDTIVQRGPDDQPSFDVNLLLEVSETVERALQQRAPAIVDAARSFAREVVFIPVTATGGPPRFDGSDEAGRPNLMFRAGTLEPRWVELPLLYAMSRATTADAGPGLIPTPSPETPRPREMPAVYSKKFD